VETAIEQAVERVVATMRDQLGEPLTIDDMARAAMFSKFHFSRIFQRVTGVSPGRFLWALRLQQAKKLLVSTSLNVSDISVRVGYSSVGTFSSRFSKSVGLSPTTYRRLGGFTSEISVDSGSSTPGRTNGIVEGTVWPRPSGQRGLIFVGLFPDRIPQGRPVSCTILDRPGPFVLTKVPEGVWHLLSHSVDSRPDEASEEQSLFVGNYGPITVRRDSVVKSADVRLKPMRALDPPILLALLDVRKTALNSVSSHELAA